MVEKQIKQISPPQADLRSVPKRAAAAALGLLFWLVAEQEHVVVQRPMPSPEQAVGTVGAAAERKPLLKRQTRHGRGRIRLRGRRSGCGGRWTLRLQGGENKQTGQAVLSKSEDVGDAPEERSVRVGLWTHRNITGLVFRGQLQPEKLHFHPGWLISNYSSRSVESPRGEKTAKSPWAWCSGLVFTLVFVRDSSLMFLHMFCWTLPGFKWLSAEPCSKCGCFASWRVVIIQDQMLSTAQQMLQDSRSKIELIRLQIIKVTQAGGGGGGDDDGNQNNFPHGGQPWLPQSELLSG